jgi:branched-chain amino acid transport system permease protein
MEEFLNATMRGLGQGSLYALLGVSFVIVFKATSVVNFAQPVLMILGAYFTSSFAIDHGLPFGVAVLGAIGVVIVIAGVAERIAMRPMVGEPVFSAAMVTVGIFFVLQVVAGDLIGTEQRQVGDPWGLERFQVGEVTIFHVDVARVVIGALCIGAVALFFKYSRWGLAMRGTAFSQETALAQGVPVGRMFSLAWILAGALGAVAGVLVGMGGGGFDQQTSLIALKALPVIILGGLDSIRGALVGGIVIGLAEAWTKAYQGEHLAFLGSNFDQVVPYIVMLIVLLVRPYGLWGTPEVRRV